jgi:arsenate reductase (thioredoxin)
MKQKVLFVCIHNSARSQMAEELLRSLASERFEVESAGVEPGMLNPIVVELLKEKGIDISGKKTQKVADLLTQNKSYDYVITVCDAASAQQCPHFPGTKRLQWGFTDPSQFKGTQSSRLQQTRAVRDAIEKVIRQWLSTNP